ncbi:MAG: hypothetical protein M1602_03955 [Firmicutes bacterium]|nr:hypothetical protein [Bacillota bacterium]
MAAIEPDHPEVEALRQGAVVLVGAATHAALELFVRLGRFRGLGLVIRLGPGAAAGHAAPARGEG